VTERSEGTDKHSILDHEADEGGLMIDRKVT
jgi:hypothetical protein